MIVSPLRTVFPFGREGSSCGRSTRGWAKVYFRPPLVSEGGLGGRRCAPRLYGPRNKSETKIFLSDLLPGQCQAPCVDLNTRVCMFCMYWYMPFSTIRWTFPAGVFDESSEEEVVSDYASKFCSVLTQHPRVSDWYFQFERGDQTGVPHFQGWLKHDYNASYWSSKRNALRGQLYFPGAQLALAPCKDPTGSGQISYIVNHKGKKNLKFWTSYTSEALEALRSSVPEFVPKEKTTKSRKQHKSFIQKMAEEIESKVLEVNILGETSLRYDNVPSLILEVFGETYKGLDNFIFKRHVIGVVNSLEVKHKIRDGRVKRQFLRFCETDNDLDSILHHA